MGAVLVVGIPFVIAVMFGKSGQIPGFVETTTYISLHVSILLAALALFTVHKDPIINKKSGFSLFRILYVLFAIAVILFNLLYIGLWDCC